MMTQDEIITEWTAALRSGEYEQGHGHLCNVIGDYNYHCCLGVLCELAVKHNIIPEGVVNSCSHTKSFEGSSASLPTKVREWAGIFDELGSFDNPIERPTVSCTVNALSGLNDSGVSFSEIADIIESRPKGMFVDG